MSSKTEKPKTETSPLEDLTLKQRKFVEAYVGKTNGNATRAAKEAGYASPNVQGPRMLVNVGIRAAIEWLYSQSVIGPQETLSRLSAMAKATPDDCLDDDGRFDVDKARETGAIHLVKKMTYSPVTGVIKSVEMYDAQGALDKVAKAQKLYSDQSAADVNVKVTVEYEKPETGNPDPALPAGEGGF